MDQGDWYAAIQPALYVLATYLLHYEHTHPMVGLQFLMCGKIMWNSVGDLESGPSSQTLLVGGKSNLVADRIRRELLQDTVELLQFACVTLDVSNKSIVDEAAQVLGFAKEELGVLLCAF